MADAVEGLEDLIAGSDRPLVAATSGEVRVLVFNRPQVRNAMSLEVRQEFARMTREADADEAVKAIIITGAAGDFTAGVDLKEYMAGPTRPPMFRPHPGEAARAVIKPMIAAVDGPCVTGGLEVALSCSFIVASDRARFADTHAKVGRFPSWGLSALLPRAIGTRRARQMSLTGEFITAATAYDWGLVNEVVTPSGLLTRCLEIAGAIAAANPRSVELQMELMKHHDGAPLADALAAEDAAIPRWRAHNP